MALAMRLAGILALFLGVLIPSTPLRAASCGFNWNAPIRHVTGIPPHRSWIIPDPKQQWDPLTMDSRYVLMLRGHSWANPDALSMALVRVGAHTMTLIPRGAYPYRGVPLHWELDWPWIAGLISTTPLPGPPTWQLWAGIVQTGSSFLLDSAHRPNRPAPGAVPDFALNHGRVTWTYNAVKFPGATIADRLEYRVAVEDLVARKRTFLTPFQRSPLGKIALSGDLVVWQRDAHLADRNHPYPLVDLMEANLRTHRITQLSHSTTRSHSSETPNLAGNLLLFDAGVWKWGVGKLILVDLAHRIGGQHRAWWQSYRSRVLGQGSPYAVLTPHLANWWEEGLFDLDTSTLWTFPKKRDPTRMPAVQAIGGRNVVTLTYSHSPHSYAVWRLDTCPISG